MHPAEHIPKRTGMAQPAAVQNSPKHAGGKYRKHDTVVLQGKPHRTPHTHYFCDWSYLQTTLHKQPYG